MLRPHLIRHQQQRLARQPHNYSSLSTIGPIVQRRINANLRAFSQSTRVSDDTSPTRMPPTNWKTLAPSPPTGTLTVKAQGSLPKLPVPDLSSTLSKLKRTLKPLAQSAEELKETERKVDEFASGLAGTLQERLVKRQAETVHWLEEWWDAGAYNGYRDSVVINVSYFYGFDKHPPFYNQTPAARAAALARATLLFRRKYKQGELAPEATKEGAICMDTYRWMFDCCRIPGPEGLDWSTSYAKEGDSGNEGHIIVLRKNRVWKIDCSKDGSLLSLEDLERQFQYVYDNTDREYPAVGLLTASNRDVWAKDYTELASDPANASILREIHSSAFIVSLDTYQPSDTVSFSRALWHGLDSTSTSGSLSNRWVDKPVQYIVFDNGRAGIMGEHSIMDGTPIARMCDDVLDAIAGIGNHGAFDCGTSVSNPSELKAPVALDWSVSSKTQDAIVEARKAAEELTGSQALGFLLTDYGKATIKRFGVSPDSWAQMIVQLAHGRLLRSTGDKGPVATYEAASTRKFFKGRTEAIRVVSEESEAWVKSMDDASVDSAKKVELLKVASTRHIQLAREAGNGQGTDRHMLGLKKFIEPSENVPELYSDPLFTRSSYWRLSTSAIFSKHFDAYGWGEVVPDGFGVAYMTGYDDRLVYTVTSRKEMPNAQFCDEIQKASMDMYNLFAAKARL